MVKVKGTMDIYHNFTKKIHVHMQGIIDVQGPVFQSVVSLTNSLRVISLTVLADSIYNNLIFLAEKM